MIRIFVLIICSSLVIGSLQAQNRLSGPARYPEEGRITSTIHLADEPRSLAELGKEADLIVDATVEAILGVRKQDPRFPSSLMTDVLLTVKRVLKGPATEKAVTFYHGGTNGKMDVIASQDPPLQVGERYILCLKRDTRGNLPDYSIPEALRYYRLGYWHSTFEVRANNRIKLRPEANPVLSSYENVSVDDFVAAIERSVRSPR